MAYGWNDNLAWGWSHVPVWLFWYSVDPSLPRSSSCCAKLMQQLHHEVELLMLQTNYYHLLKMSRTSKPKFLHGRKFSWHLEIQSITVGTRGDWNSSWFLQLKLRNFFQLQCSTFLPESVWICRRSWCSLRQPTTRKTVSRVCCCALEKKLPGYYYYWTMEWILEHHHALLLLLLLLIIIFLQIG